MALDTNEHFESLIAISRLLPAGKAAGTTNTAGLSSPDDAENGALKVA
jgi:hypothetical protein